MSIKASIYHLTHYKYDKPIPGAADYGSNGLAFQDQVISHSLKVTPGKSLRQSAAGPLRQLSRPLRVSGAGDGAEDRGRSRADMTVYNRSTSSSRNRPPSTIPSTIGGPEGRPFHLHEARAGGAAAQGASEGHRSYKKQRNCRHGWSASMRCCRADGIYDPHGTRRAGTPKRR